MGLKPGPSNAALPVKGLVGGGGVDEKFSTWVPKVCKIMALMAIFMGLGLLVCILWGFRLFGF